MEDLCNVCKNNKFYFTRKNKVIDINNTNWEHQSTAELAGITSNEFYIGLCKKCLNAKLFPEFDTNLIYRDKEGYAVRKKTFEKFFPSKKYNDLDKISLLKKKRLIKSEIKRIKNIALDFLVFLNIHFKHKQEIKILDFGGADGYLSTLLTNLLKIQTNKKMIISNFDPQFIDQTKDNDKNLYDFVIISHVLEHVHNLDDLFSKLKKIINFNTIIFFEVPDERYFVFKKFCLIEKVFLHYHVNFFSAYGIRKLFKANGFNTQISYKLSSYRGNSLTIISGFASQSINEIKNGIFYEFFSLFNFLFNKLLTKFKNL